MDHEVTRLVFQLAVILFAAKIGGEVFDRYLKLPVVLGEVAVGIAIGPFALGGVELPVFGALFSNVAHVTGSVEEFVLPVSGNLEFTLTRDGSLVDRVKFDLKGGEGSLHLPGVFPAPPHITSLSIRGDTDVAYSSINIDNLTIATSGPVIKFRGKISGMPERTGIAGDFEFTEMPFAQLGNYWPEFFMTKARSWILTGSPISSRKTSPFLDMAPA